MIIALAADHGGYTLKEAIKDHLRERKIKIVDLGTDSEEPVDYPSTAKPALTLSLLAEPTSG